MKPVFVTALLRIPVALPEPVDVSYAASVAPFQFGGGIEAGVLKLDGGALTLGASTDIWHRSFDAALFVRAVQVEQQVNFGWRFDTCAMTDRTEGGCVWWNVRMGPRAWYLGITSWEDVVAFGMGADTGLGVTFGPGDWRTNLGLSVGTSLGFGTWGGTLDLPEESMSWTWTAGGLRATFSGGVEF